MQHIPDEKRKCPRTGFTQGCRDLTLNGTCQDRWVDLKIRHPQTGIESARWGCVDDLALIVQLSLEQRLVGVQAAVEKRGDNMTSMLVQGIALQAKQHQELLEANSGQLQLGYDAPREYQAPPLLVNDTAS